MGRVRRRPVRRPPRQAGDRHLLRQPHPPHPADRRRRHRATGAPSPRWAGRWPRTWPWPAPWACCTSPTTPWSTSRRSATSTPGRVCVISTGSPGRADVGAGPHGRGREQVARRSARATWSSSSSHAIPGNEANVGKVIDGLYRLGAEVIHSGPRRRCTSAATPCRRSSRRCCRSAGRSAFIPVHGEFRHLTHHARLATEMGVPESRILLAEDGDVIELTDSGIDFAGEVPAGYLYVDGIVGDVGRGVLRDRRVLAEEGVVVVVVTVDAKSGRGAHRAGDHHPGLGVRPRGRGAARARPGRPCWPASRRRLESGGDRLRDPQAPRPVGARPLRQRADQAPADDRPDRHGGLSRLEVVRSAIIRDPSDNISCLLRGFQCDSGCGPCQPSGLPKEPFMRRLLIPLVLIVPILAACGGGSSTKAKTAAPAVATSVTTGGGAATTHHRPSQRTPATAAARGATSTARSRTAAISRT